MDWRSCISSAAIKAGAVEYFPMIDTLRLFAGWLLAWYGVVYVLGSLHWAGTLPEGIPFIQALFESSLILRFACGTFLFLLPVAIFTFLLRNHLLRGMSFGAIRK